MHAVISYSCKVHHLRDRARGREVWLCAALLAPFWNCGKARRIRSLVFATTSEGGAGTSCKMKDKATAYKVFPEASAAFSSWQGADVRLCVDKLGGRFVHPRTCPAPGHTFCHQQMSRTSKCSHAYSRSPPKPVQLRQQPEISGSASAC